MQLAVACVAARALLPSGNNSSVLALLSQHVPTAGLQQQRQQQPGSAASLSSSSSTMAAACAQHRAPLWQEHRGFTTGAAPRDQDQQQQQQRPQSVNESAQEVSRAFLAKSLDAEELWLAAVSGKLKIWSARQMPELKGKEVEVVEAVRAAYLEALSRAATGRLLTHRSRSQLKQACLAVATYKTLLELAPGDAAGIEQHIADAMGGLYAPFMLGGLKLSSWAKRLLLRQSSISQAVDTLHTLARDMEGACHVSVQPLSCSGDSDDDEQLAVQHQQQQQDGSASQQEDPVSAAEAAAREHHKQPVWANGAALTVDSCMIAEVMQAEGVPQLLRYFCCQHNMSWLESYRAQGVDAHLDACIGKGDACCRMTVTPA